MQTTDATQSPNVFFPEGRCLPGYSAVLFVSIQRLRSAIFQNGWTMDELIELFPIFTHCMLASYPFSCFQN